MYPGEAKVDGWVWSIAALATLFLALRIYCRLYRYQGLWWDDDILTLSWMTLMVGVGFTTGMLANGFTDDEKHPWAEVLYKGSASSLGMAAAWTKTAFAVTLYRMSSHWIDKTFLLFVIVSINVVYILAAFAAWVRGCDTSEQTAGTYLPGECWTETSVISISAAAIAWSGLLDFVLALYPWRMVWRLEMRKTEKVGVCIAMSLGVVAGIVVVVRLVLMVGLLNTTNLNYDMAMVGITNAIEPSVSIMAQSIPVFRVLLRPRSVPQTEDGGDDDDGDIYTAYHDSEGSPNPSAGVGTGTDIQPYSAIQGNTRADRSLHLIRGPNGHVIQDKDAAVQRSYFEY